jgi:uncharacterized delta-60 repeat protein
MPHFRLLRNLLLPALLTAATTLFAQVPIIDYDFLAVPPSALVNKVVEQPDGKILVGGFFMNYAGSGNNHLVRLNPDGTVDPTWNISGAGPSNQVMDIALMTDGRIVIAGNFVTYNGINSYFITRLQPNGARDFTFNIPPNAINGAVLAIDIQGHDKVVAVGEFFTCYGHSMPHIARFLNNGEVDLDFDIGFGFNGITRDVLVLPDERILVGGDFSNYDLNDSWRLALLQAGGPYDGSMVMAPGFLGGSGTVRKVLRQPDGKILVGGSFAAHNGQPSQALARINLDGTRDPSFLSPFYPYALIVALAVQDDGRIFAGGEYTGGMYDPNVPGPGRMIRLQADGTRDDAAYDMGQGPGTNEPVANVRDITIQDDGKILVGGFFGSFHNPAETQYRNLIRLHPQAATGITEASAPTTLQVAVDPGSGDLLLWHPFPQTGQGTLRIHGASGQLLQERTLHSAQDGPLRMAHDLSPGMYLLVVDGAGQRATGRVVVY